MDRSPNIGEHGLIGDLQTAALVTSDGTVDFFCCPRFDSPTVFASLLDAEHGGYFSIKPAADGYVTRQLYFPDTAMLINSALTLNRELDRRAAHPERTAAIEQLIASI